MKKTLLAVLALLGAAVVPSMSQELKLSANNIDDIVNAMTLEEKATLLVGGKNKNYSGESTTVGYTEDLVVGAAGVTKAIPRLGIPATVMADGPAGVRIKPTREEGGRTYYATAFPVGVTLASTWNPALVETVGQGMGQEVLDYGIDVLLAPGLNIHRSPLCGRNFEYFSEDPIVSGKMAAALVRGIQSKGVGTSVKHFAANSQETNRQKVDEIVSQRALRELYLKGFEIAVKEGKPWTVMSSYNKLNGPYTMENYELLTTILRDEWGYDGMVVTDWIGPRNTVAQVHAGNDMMQPGMDKQTEDIIQAVKEGKLSMADVDRNVKRVLQYIVKTPRFRGYVFSENPDIAAHAAITRKAADEGMVLLKNANHALPLRKGGKVAVFGLTSYDFMAGGTGSGHVCRPYTVNVVQGLENAGFEVTEDLKELYTTWLAYQESKAANDRIDFDWRWGRGCYPEMELNQVCIDKQAKAADVAVITIGRQGGEAWDRQVQDDFNLSAMERQQLEDICAAFHAEGKKVIVVINSGGVIETDSWKALPDAILLAWQPGLEGGNTIADIISGKVNPSGKLTMTFPVSVMDHPSSLNFPTTASKVPAEPVKGKAHRGARNVDYTLHQEGINVGYRYFDTADKEVSYPFGYGLSYTDFTYSRPTVKAVPGGFRATVTVTNTGDVAGKEAVQLYVTAPDGKLDKPAHELKAFAKTGLLKPGQSETLTFDVTDYDLASFDEATQNWVADKGRYAVKFGASARDLRASGTYAMPREFRMKVHDVLRPNVGLE